MTRKFFVGGNWKCNGTLEAIRDLTEALNKADIPSGVEEVVVAPPALYLAWVQDHVQKHIQVAAQNCWVKGNGAFTGELSAEMLSDLKVGWVILGHSERRSLLGESSEFVADKTAYALSKGLSVILCVGESQQQRDANQTFSVIADQLKPVAAKVSDWSKIVVAYEPVWAIGTGQVATPDQAQEVHQQIRSWLTDNVSPDVAEHTRIIYGGSVTAKNSSELSKKVDIDGFLVGGASLKPEFRDIITAVGNKLPDKDMATLN
jgi:triosephosphate isomerase